ncbi:hypothetical protein [Natrarchaeobius oligotrophus]|uniref:hypothetical protein n=1 Tax=Natrarchaeobius oligotrophus TaxID=3455743 RepID=UPI000F533023|nr:hypothetical protein [Natrarchaeobius chitinivorans]
MPSSRTGSNREKTLAEITLLLLGGIVIVFLWHELIFALVVPISLIVIYLLYRLLITAEEIAEKL